MLGRAASRRGTTIVECALVYPLTVFLIFGLIISGMGVFRYQEMAALAREGARYAIVHGSKYQQVTGQPAATAADVYNNVLLPKMVSLDPARLTYSVTWTPDKRPGSTVQVQLTYHWVPEVFLGGIDLTSTSTMTISY
jgi:Flp pilus assembly protein TadG